MQAKPHCNEVGPGVQPREKEQRPLRVQAHQQSNLDRGNDGQSARDTQGEEEKNRFARRSGCRGKSVSAHQGGAGQEDTHCQERVKHLAKPDQSLPFDRIRLSKQAPIDCGAKAAVQERQIIDNLQRYQYHAVNFRLKIPAIEFERNDACNQRGNSGKEPGAGSFVKVRTHWRVSMVPVSRFLRAVGCIVQFRKRDTVFIRLSSNTTTLF